jgi:hypothetical protein
VADAVIKAPIVVFYSLFPCGKFIVATGVGCKSCYHYVIKLARMALKRKGNRLVLRMYSREQGHALVLLSNPLLIMIINVHCRLKAACRALS